MRAAVCGQLCLMVRYGTGDGVVLPSIVPVPYLSPTVPCHQRRLATMPHDIQIGLSNVVVVVVVVFILITAENCSLSRTFCLYLTIAI